MLIACYGLDWNASGQKLQNKYQNADFYCTSTSKKYNNINKTILSASKHFLKYTDFVIDLLAYWQSSCIFKCVRCLNQSYQYIIINKYMYVTGKISETHQHLFLKFCRNRHHFCVSNARLQIQDSMDIISHYLATLQTHSSQSHTLLFFL